MDLTRLAKDYYEKLLNKFRKKAHKIKDFNTFYKLFKFYVLKNSKKTSFGDVKKFCKEYGISRELFYRYYRYLFSQEIKRIKMCHNGHTWIDGDTCPVCYNLPINQ